MKRYVCVIITLVGLGCLSWLGMQLVHESGHCLGAVLTGGTITQVVLHPAGISRTDVSPNPQPGVVAWLGPITGCLVPAAVCLACRVSPARTTSDSDEATSPGSQQRLPGMLGFFAGFCLIANGAYLLFGTPDRVGDCGDLLNAGTPSWVLYLFGLTAVTAGLFQWHRLGSIRLFVDSPLRTPLESAIVVTATLLLVSLELWWAGW